MAPGHYPGNQPPAPFRNHLTDEEYEVWCESDEYVNIHNGIIDNVATDFQKEFFEDVDYLHERFHVMGYPVRFTSWSKEVYDWGDTQKDPVLLYGALFQGNYKDLMEKEKVVNEPKMNKYIRSNANNLDGNVSEECMKYIKKL